MDEVEQVRERQEQAARKLGIVGVELEIIRTTIEIEEEPLEVAKRLGMIQARFLPMRPKEQH